MAATEPDSAASRTEQVRLVLAEDEPLAADVSTGSPRLTTRMLVATALVLGVVLAASLVVALVVLHHPRLAPVPVPSVSSIA